MVKTYWWRSEPNFGDLLNVPLLDHFAEVSAVWSGLDDAELVCVGSNLQLLPVGWSGTVAGTGKLFDRPVDLSSARVLGLRGHLSAEGVHGDFVVGDPVLLVDELIPKSKPDFVLGVVPHWSDVKLAARFAHLAPHVIDPRGDPLEVVADISRCEKIVSSSLHGVVVADAFGIPRRIERFERMSLEGGDFKFRDYLSALEMPLEFGKLELAPRHSVERIQAELFDMFLRV